jgi:hypothetical protein
MRVLRGSSLRSLHSDERDCSWNTAWESKRSQKCTPAGQNHIATWAHMMQHTLQRSPTTAGRDTTEAPSMQHNKQKSRAQRGEDATRDQTAPDDDAAPRKNTKKTSTKKPIANCAANKRCRVGEESIRPGAGMGSFQEVYRNIGPLSVYWALSVLI